MRHAIGSLPCLDLDLVFPDLLCAVNLLGQLPLVELVHPDADQVAGDVVLSGQPVENGLVAQVYRDEVQLKFRVVTTVSVSSCASILRRLARGAIPESKTVYREGFKS